MPFIINFLATYLIFFFPLVGVYFFLKNIHHDLVIKLGLAFITERITEFLIKTAFYTPRPYLTNHLPTYVTILPTDSSFPSGHTMMVFAFATIIFLHFKNQKLGMFSFVVALFVGVGRILANVHYPVDVISGLILGVTIGALCDKIKPYDKRNNSSPRRKTKK
jgi:membrane-associated phospholipid phosphatase